MSGVLQGGTFSDGATDHRDRAPAASSFARWRRSSADKHSEPPVVAITEDGQFIVPLLGGHHGANRLARELIEESRRDSRVITHGDAIFVSGTALDDAPDGYYLRNPEDYKDFAVALLDGEPVAIDGDAPWLDTLPQSTQRPHSRSRSPSGDPLDPPSISSSSAMPCGRRRLRARHRAARNSASSSRIPCCRNWLVPRAVACYASIDLKEDEPAVNALDPRCAGSDSSLRRNCKAQAHRLKIHPTIVLAETGTPVSQKPRHWRRPGRMPN